ncbi:MAG: hypothetical protein O7H41_03865 [Planctomycetota bacterium]|nr:hypothetical protein [Planctomycetota bacterium]
MNLDEGLRAASFPCASTNLRRVDPYPRAVLENAVREPLLVGESKSVGDRGMTGEPVALDSGALIPVEKDP